MRKFDIISRPCGTENYGKLLTIKSKTVGTYETQKNIKIMVDICWFDGSGKSYSNKYSICYSSSNIVTMTLLDSIPDSEYNKKSMCWVRNEGGDIDIYIKRSKSRYGQCGINVYSETPSIFGINQYILFETPLSKLVNPKFETTPNIFGEIDSNYILSSNGTYGYRREGNLVTVYGSEITSGAVETTIGNIGSENSPRSVTVYGVGRCINISSHKIELLNVNITTEGDIVVRSNENSNYGSFTITYIR